MQRMKWKGVIFFGLIASSIFLGAYYPNFDYKQKESLILNAVINYLDVLHFKPKSLNDELSSDVFNEFIKSVDPGKRFLTQTEVNQLEIYRDQIDDQMKSRTFEFFDASYEIIESSRKRAESYFKELIDSDVNLNSEDYIEMDSEKRNFATDEAELKEVWKNLLQFDIITRLENKIKAQEESEDEEEPVKTVEELKSEVILAAKESYEDWFKRLFKDRRSDFFEIYINSLTHLYDPHSVYFNPKEKEDFDIRMGGKLEGIGARLQTEGDFTKVISIVPGGPTWKGNELEVNDLIMSVMQKGKDFVDIKGMRIDDVVQKIRGDKGTVVILKVKKSDGNVIDIEIERDEVILDEIFARSLIINKPDLIDNVGYIRLAKFYSTFEGKDGNSCAIDVANEIEKLKNENVNGIILDLRNNGGGSLSDVVDMSGLFIEKGPIVQVKPRNKDAYVREDEDPDVQYDGPLVVMVNSFSASASEILAAALQDYNRAIIVGSNSTFGKATVQRFVDLDRAYRDQEDLKPLGQLKITMQKFYRVDGGSTQLRGVKPDVILPNNYQFIDTGEKDYDYAMDWSEIEAVDFSQNVYQINHMDAVRAKSEARTVNHKDFQLVLENAKRLKKNRDLTMYPLSLPEYTNFVNKRNSESEKYDDLFSEKIETLNLSNLPIDTSYINSDESRIARNDDWKEGLEKDFYLDETLHILKDMIELNQNKIGFNENR